MKKYDEKFKIYFEGKPILWNCLFKAHKYFSCSVIKNKREIVVLHRLQMVTHRTKYISTQQKRDRNSFSPWLTKYFYVKPSLWFVYRHTKFESCTRNGLVVESKLFPILYIWLFSFEAILFAFNWRLVLFTDVYHLFLIITVDFIIYPWLSLLTIVPKRSAYS